MRLRRSAPRASGALCLTLAWLTMLLSPARAAAAARMRTLVIGYNSPPRTIGGEEPTLAELRYADDDAASMYELLAPLSDSIRLLTLFDSETQRARPTLSRSTRLPTIGNLRAAVAAIHAEVEADHARGDRTVVTIFFSGHGAVDDGGAPALALHGGSLNRSFLYEEMLAPLGADVIHLLVDACHAEAVVAPRGPEPSLATTTAKQAHDALMRRTLARFPHVGAILASSVDAESHEWDVLGHGVFTHELSSALRGAADVNGDRALEYSEVVAFMSAANRRIEDSRARLSVVARPPQTNLREPLVEWERASPQRLAWLRDIPSGQGVIRISDAGGRRLITLHGDEHFETDLLLPPNARLYVQRSDELVANLQLQPGEARPFRDLAFRRDAARRRGVVAESIRRGLFAGTFGRGFYEGYVARAPQFVPVDFPGRTPLPRAPRWPPRRRVLVAGTMERTVAADLYVAHGAVVGLRPGGGRGWLASLGYASDEDGPLSEHRLSGELGLQTSIARGPHVEVWLGGSVGAGLAVQRHAGTRDVRAERLSTGQLSAGPSVGVAVRAVGRLGVASELAVDGLLFKQEGRWTMSWLPSATMGLLWEL